LNARGPETAREHGQKGIAEGTRDPYAYADKDVPGEKDALRQIRPA